LPEFYTTSSCAGRIVLLKEPKSKKKKDYEWLYVTHSKPDFNKIRTMLKEVPEETIWLRMEPFIIHVCVKNLKTANDFMDLLRSVGLKHSGILTTKKRIMIEVSGNERMDVPIAGHKRLFINKEYLEFLVGEAYNKLYESRKRLNKLKKKLEKLNK